MIGNIKFFNEYCNKFKDFKELSADKLAINLVKPYSNVLSCGCGHGREVKFLVQEKKCKVIAIDINEGMIKLSEKEEPNANYILSDIVNFKTKEKQDYIVCLWNTINYLLSNKKKVEFIKICQGNLKDGGKLIIVTSNIFSYWRHFFSNIKHLTLFNYYPSKIETWFVNTNFKYEKISCGIFNIIVANKIKDGHNTSKQKGDKK